VQGCGEDLNVHSSKRSHPQSYCVMECDIDDLTFLELEHILIQDTHMYRVSMGERANVTAEFGSWLFI